MALRLRRNPLGTSGAKCGANKPPSESGARWHRFKSRRCRSDHASPLIHSSVRRVMALLQLALTPQMKVERSSARIHMQ
jgi:hypothetical protein